MPKDLFPSFVAQSLLFLSFIIATFLPLFIIKAEKASYKLIVLKIINSYINADHVR